MTHPEEAAALQQAQDLKKARVRSRILNAVHNIESYDTLLNVAGYLREQGYKCDTRDLLTEADNA